MNITHLHAENFKGISKRVDIRLAPITLFIGANSSGKSTALHALAAMAQTVRNPNDARPLILDSETALVHLGRFIEIIHTHKYTDSIRLGLTVSGIPVRNRRDSTRSHIANAIYDFRSTLRTQEVFLDKGEVSFDEASFAITKKGAGYQIKGGGLTKLITATRSSAFTFRPEDYHKISDENCDRYDLFHYAQAALVQQLRRIYYLGPFRQPPQRRYQTRGAAPLDVGAQGESTVAILANEVMRKQSRHVLTQVGRWLETLGVGKKIEASRVGGSDLFELIVTMNDGKKLPIADLGYGISQVLPVLTQSAFAPANSTLLFEQPELHLHPLAQKPLASVFIDAQRRSGHQFILETHSRELFFEFVNQIRAGNLSLDDVAAYKVDRVAGNTVFIPIAIERTSHDVDIFTNWEEGFCK